MAKGGDGREVSIHLKLGDDDFSKQFNSIIGGLADQLNSAGKQFASQMRKAEKSIRSSTEALSDTMAGEPRRKARSKGASGGSSGAGAASAEDSMARANRLMQQMEKRSIDASEGALRMGTEYEKVEKVVSDLVTATSKLKEGSRISPDLKAQNRLRKQAGKTINQLIKKVKELARTEQITREQAEQMLGDLKRGAAQYSDERIKAEKAIQSVQSKSMTEFRRQMRSRVKLVDALPDKHDKIRKQLDAEKKALLQKVEANEDNIQAVERLAEVKKTISKLDKQERSRRQAQAALRQEQETQRAAGSEMAFGVDMKREKKRVKQQLEEMESMIANQDPFSALRGKMGFGDGLRQEKNQLEDIFEMMDGQGEDAAEGLAKAQRRRLNLLDEEIDKLIQRDQMGDLSAQDEMRLNELTEQRARTLKSIENTEEQITREKKNQTISARRNNGGLQGTGRKASRRRRRRNGSLASDNAALQASRLVQDAPYGLMGIVNNIDMAVESMVKLRQQSETTGQALKKMAFGSTASLMLWTNALFAAYIMLQDHIEVADEFGDMWDDTKAQLFGAGDAIEELSGKIDEVAEKEIEILDETSTEEAGKALQKVTERLVELRKERAELVSGPQTKGALSGGFLDDYGPGAMIARFTRGGEIDEKSKQIESLETFQKKLKDYAAQGFGLQEAFKKSAKFGPLVVKEHLKTLKAIRGHQEEMAAIALKGRDGEEAIPFKKDQIKAKYKTTLRELRSELKAENREFLMAEAVDDVPAALAADQRSQQIQAEIAAQKAARERELANVGEDGPGSEDDPADALRALIDMRHEVQRRRIELDEEGLEEKKQIIDHELKVQKVGIDRQLEDFEGTKEQEAEFAELIATRKEQATTQAERDKTEAVEEHARKRRQILKENAEVELRLQRARLDLQDDTDRTQIERSRLKAKNKVLQLEEQIAKAEDEGYSERADNLRKIRDLQARIHEERVSDIREETRERQHQMRDEIAGMIEGAERYRSRIATFQGGLFRGAIQGEVERIRMQKEEAIRAAEGQFAAKMESINELEKQAEKTLANEMKFYQRRLDLFEWFRQEKAGIQEDYNDQEQKAIKDNQKAFASMAGTQLSSRLGEISSGLNSLQQTFVANRKKQLMEQGMAEEEAAKKAEEAGRRRFAIKKKIAIAEATVNTFNAAMNAYEQASQFGGFAGGIAAFTTALTFGFAQVAKIRAMGIESGAGGESGGGVSTSGLGSTTDATRSQVTDSTSPFASEPNPPDDSGISRGQMEERSQSRSARDEVSNLRDDMERHTEAIKNMKPEATMSDDTAIEAGDAYSDHKDDDTY